MAKAVLWFLVAAGLCAFAQRVTAEPATVTVVGPKVRTVIIIGEQPRYQYPYWGGHAIVQRNLLLITRDADGRGGINVPIVQEKDLRGKDLDAAYDFRIWVGDQPRVQEILGPALTKLDDDGFILRCTGRDLYLCGKHKWGTHWAAYDLFERYAGCRWYMEGGVRFWMPKEDGMIGLGDVIPRRERWEIPSAFDIVEEPSYKMRWFMTAPAHSFRLRYRDRFHHALVNILPPQKYGAEHPEYYPELDGKRHVPQPPREQDFQPCISNPEVVRLVAAAAIEHFDKNPADTSFSVGMNDTNKFCRCARCQAMAPAAITEPGARTAYAFFRFYNEVAEQVAQRHPDKRLGCLAYAGIKGVPAGSIRLHPMLVPYLTVDSAQLWDEPVRASFRENVAKWNSLATRMGIYEYIYGREFIVPRIYNRHLLSNIRERYGVGVDGFYAECGPNWGLDGPKYWLIDKLLWDHRKDPEALAAQYYSDMFGPAAGEMKAYFDFLEQTWCTQPLKSAKSNYRWMGDVRQLEIFPPAKCDEAMRLLGAAETRLGAASRAAADRRAELAEAARRVEFFKTSFAFTRMMSYRYAACQALERGAAIQPPDWAQMLNGLETWLESGSLRNSYEAVRNLKFAIDTVSGHGANLESFRYHFDGNPGPARALHALSQEMVKRAAAQGPVRSADEMRRRIALVPAEMTAGREELRAPNAVRFAVELAGESGFLFIRRAAQPPTLDGTIEAHEWGAPAYSGRFHEGYVIEDRVPHRTNIYAVAHDKTLYLAFDCEGDPKLIGASVEGVNTDTSAYPAMARDDAIALSLLNAGRSAMRVLVNANGSIQDEKRGICQAKVRRTEQGWQVEMSLPLSVIGSGAAIARYSRVAGGPKEHRTQFSTIAPVARGVGNVIGTGNHDACMCFVWGPRWVQEGP